MWAFDGERSGDDVRGEVHIDGERFGHFEIHRSPEPLPTVAPSEFADCVGIYRFPNARSVIVTARFWGDLVFFDTANGRRGTLFPTSADTFFAGPALYVPGPVAFRAECLRDATGEVVGLAWTREGATTEQGTKQRLEEVEIEIESDGAVLAGTLIRPPGPGPHPAAIVLGGSGWSDRSSVRWDADVLASQGIATLIYDKRGYGESGGRQTVAFSQTSDDAIAALRTLQAREDIDPERIGLTGRSRGGWFAPLAASRSDDFAFLVLFVAPAVSPAEQETTRRLNLLRDRGVSEAEIALAESYLEKMWRYARTAEGWDELVAASEDMAERGWLEVLESPGRPDAGDWEWARLNMHYDPLPVLREVRTPVLALFGGLDRNVVADINHPLMQDALIEAGNTDYSVVLLPNADHGLRRAAGPPRPFHRSVGLAPLAWHTVFDWLEPRIGESK